MIPAPMTDSCPSPCTTPRGARTDARLIAAGTSGFELMQRAAHAAWRALRRRWPDAGAVTVLAGRGNNAGDGYLLAALAQRAGWQVRVLAVGDPQTLQGDAALACAEARDCGVPIEPRRAGAAAGRAGGCAARHRSDRRGARAYASAIAAINASGRPVLAIDLPSGLCANTGQVLGQTVRADLSVTFIGLKLGLFTADGPDRVGALVFDDLQADPGIVAQVASEAVRLDHGSLARVAPRSPTAHKGSFGGAGDRR